MKETVSIKKSTLIAAIAVTAALLIAGTGSVIAATKVAENNAIGTEAAISFALVDAGVSPEDATVLKSSFDYEQRLFVYEVDFIANGIKYDYIVKAADGTIISAAEEIIYKAENGAGVLDEASADDSVVAATDETADAADTALSVTAHGVENVPVAAPGAQQGDGAPSETAKNPAQPASAAVTSSQSVGTSVTTQRTLSQSATTSAAQSNAAVQKTTAQPAAAATTQNTTAQPASQSSASKAPTAAAATPASQAPAATQPAAPQPSPAASSSAIGVDAAKNIATQQAGVDANAVNYSKAKQDYEDGKPVYEIDFYAGGKEYEVEVDAGSGNVTKYEVDNDNDYDDNDDDYDDYDDNDDDHDDDDD